MRTRIFGLLIGLTLTSVVSTSVFAATPFKEAVSADDLASAYRAAQAGGDKVRILIVPGHEPLQGGTQFGGYYERELALLIAEELRAQLSTDENFEVIVARTSKGWTPTFSRYFDREKKDIEAFVEDHKDDMERLERRGKVTEIEEQAAHNAAPSDVALRLYGITKWANEHRVDLMLHLHLNDETGHNEDERGVHSGMSIYVPDEIYGNAKASKALAAPIFARLNTTTATSTFGYEQRGILEDRELIAIGAFNTSKVPSLLIEYGYIYEPRITGGGAMNEVLQDFAYQTALGVKDFFGSPGRPRFSSKVLPYTFTSDVLATTTSSSTPEQSRGIYALQAVLRALGFYPGTEASLTVCPVSGISNVCTLEALKAFQASKGYEAVGTLGPLTRSALNTYLGTQVVMTPPVPTPTPAPTPIQNACSPLTATLALDATDATTNGEVSKLQTILAKDTTIYPEGLITGYYGPATDRAVKRFQVERGVVAASSTAYGLVGPATKAALLTSCTAS